MVIKLRLSGKTDGSSLLQSEEAKRKDSAPAAILSRESSGHSFSSVSTGGLLL